MPRRARMYVAGLPYHVVQRGVLTRATIFRFLSQLLCIAGAITGTAMGCDVDLSSPEATIKGYCTGEGGVATKYFYFPVEPGVMGKRIWSECSIVKVTPTNKAGQEFGRIAVKSEDMEVTTEVKMIHPEKDNPRTRFWYLLRNFDGQWKIIEYNHIPDQNYPAYD